MRRIPFSLRRLEHTVSIYMRARTPSYINDHLRTPRSDTGNSFSARLVTLDRVDLSTRLLSLELLNFPGARRLVAGGATSVIRNRSTREINGGRGTKINKKREKEREKKTFSALRFVLAHRTKKKKWRKRRGRAETFDRRCIKTSFLLAIVSG